MLEDKNSDSLVAGRAISAGIEATEGDDTITLLTCREEGKQATKAFSALKDGTIEKCSFSAGKFFTHEEKHISNLNDLSRILEYLLDKPTKFVIRGKAKETAGHVVQRKINEPGAAFDPAPRRYVGLDIDKQECPAYFDPGKNPEEVVKWILEKLPEPFRQISCYYKFSSSQSVPAKIGDKASSKVSVHLWFWCDRPVSESEWKRFFKANPCPVDQALFSPVQIHYTARPNFYGFDDPLQKRSGILKGEHDTLAVPPMPAPEKRKPGQRPDKTPDIKQDSRDKALKLFLPYYEEGTRDRLIGGIAGVLYRGGWEAENVADFVHELAETDGDSEAMARYESALRICDAIDNDRPAQGIPTLRDDFGIDNLDEILTLLGIGKPDVKGAIARLSATSDITEIRSVVKLLVALPKAEQKLFLDLIKTVTRQSKATLNEVLKEAQNEVNSRPPMDWPDVTMELFLEGRFEKGRCLLRAADGNYWQYNGQYWEAASEDFIKKELLPYAREIADISSRRGEGREVSGLLNAALNILAGRVYRDDDPLRLLNNNAPMVINCQNGELWFDEKGEVSLRPHRPESYLRYCLNVSYDPAATSPMFDDAAFGIFGKSSDPQAMFRHFMELAGYICQPWRQIAIIVLLYGGGNNGKTSLTKIITRILGEKMIMSDRISEIETSIFKVGALDGKLMLLDDDVDEGTCLPDGFLKKISEEKTMTGQHKYKPSFEFTCRVVPVMLANSYPTMKDLSEGIRRRVMVIPFSRKFEKHEIILGLFDQIWEKEASGILNQVIAGFQRLKKRGGFDTPQDCVTAKEEWLIKSNVLTTFINDVCKKGAGFLQYIKDFYREFQNYCAEAGVKNVPGRSGVQKRLESLGYEITSLNGYPTVRGIKAPVMGERDIPLTDNEETTIIEIALRKKGE